MCQHVGEQFQAKIAGAIDLNLYSLLFYAAMGFVLVRVATKKQPPASQTPG